MNGEPNDCTTLEFRGHREGSGLVQGSRAVRLLAPLSPDCVAGARRLYGPRKVAKIISKAASVKSSPHATAKPSLKEMASIASEAGEVDFTPFAQAVEAAKERRAAAQAAVEKAQARGDDEELSAALAELADAKRAVFKAWMTLSETAALELRGKREKQFSGLCGAFVSGMI